MLSGKNLQIIENAPSRKSRTFEYNSTKYAISLSPADGGGDRAITIQVKSGGSKGASGVAGRVNVRSGEIEVEDASMFFSVYRKVTAEEFQEMTKRIGTEAITAGLDAIIARDTQGE